MTPEQRERKNAGNRAYMARKRDAWRKLHICTTCGDREAMRKPGGGYLAHCGVCEEAHMDWQREDRRQKALRAA